MRIRDTSTCYSYTISVCMGAFVFGYQLTSYGNLSTLVLNYNYEYEEYEYEDSDNTIMLLNTLLALSAIFGTSISTQVSASTAG